MNQLVGGYQGAGSKPVFWHELFGLVDGKLMPVSKKHRPFYQRKITLEMAFLEQVLNPQGINVTKVDEVASADVAFVQFKYLREIEGQEIAGLDLALQWSRSENTALQILAIKTLGEIHRTTAVAAIRNLEKSKNFVVRRPQKLCCPRLPTEREINSRC